MVNYSRTLLAVNRLRDQWDESSQNVLQRKTQLAAMLNDSQRWVVVVGVVCAATCIGITNLHAIKSCLRSSSRSACCRYEAKRVEIETWLHRMESRSERMGTIAVTADILDAQQKEQKVRVCL